MLISYEYFPENSRFQNLVFRKHVVDTTKA